MILGVNRSSVAPDVVDVLLALGLNREMATMAIPAVWWRPATTDPYSPVTMAIVEGIQDTFTKMGIKNRGDGYVDRATARGIERFAGPDWKAKPWISIIDDVLYGKQTGKSPHKEESVGYMGGLGAVLEGAPGIFTISAKGTCLPGNATTINQFKGLQREINRTLGRAELKVDGRIGSGTIRGANKALDKFPHTFGTFKSCGPLSALASQVTTFLRGHNSRAGKPQPKDPPTSKPSRVTSSGQVIHPEESLMDQVQEFVQKPVGMAVVAGGVVGLLVFLDKRKKKGR